MRKEIVRIAVVVCTLQVILFLSACFKQGVDNGMAVQELDLTNTDRYVCTGYERILWEGIDIGNRVFACMGDLVYSCEISFFYDGKSISPKLVEDLVEDYDQFEIKTRIFRLMIEDGKLSEQTFVCELDGCVIEAIVCENEELALLLASTDDYLELCDEEYLTKIGSDGQIIFHRKLEMGKGGERLSINGKGDLLLLQKNEVSFYNVNGKKLKTQKLGISSFAMDICGDREDDFYLISMEKGPLTRRVCGGKEEVIDDSHNLLEFSRTKDGRTLARNGEKAYLYLVDENSWWELFAFVSLDVCTGDILEWWMDEEDRIYLIVREGKDEGEYLVTAERKPESEIPPKEIIKLGTNGNSEEIQRAVVNFNRSNEKYRVEITNYAEMLGNYSDNSDYQASEERFLLDLASGKAMDLVFTDLLSAHEISPDGLLEDLIPYLERSNQLNAEDFFPEVLQAASYHGDLTYLSDSFHITTLLCKASLDGLNQSEWTVDSLITFAEKNSNADLFPLLQGNDKTVGEFNARNAVKNVLMLNGERLLAGDAFDKEILVKLLDKAKDAYDAGNRGTLIREALVEKKLLFVNADIGGVYDLSRCFTENFAGKDVMAIGYPTEYGQGKSIIEPCKGIGILASSEHKEAAWAFVEFYIPYSDETNKDHLSTRKSIFEKELNRTYQYAAQDLEMNDLYYIEEDALKLLEDMLGDVVGSNQKTEAEILDIINEEAQAFYSGRKTAEEVVDIIVNRVHLYSCE